MRSLSEIRFRLVQEVWNLYAFLVPPQAKALSRHPLGLPDPESVAGSVAGSGYAREVVELAEGMLAGKLPVLGYSLALADPIAWRSDPVHDVATPLTYFRRIRYLDFQASGDHKIIWEINRHQHWVLLAQAYLLTKDQRYLDAVRWQFDSWMEANPFHCGINWASALEVGFRALSWCWVLHLAGGAIGPEFERALLAALYQHGAHLARNLSFYFSPNTHLLGEAVALHAVGQMLGQPPWRNLGRQVVQEEIHRQVREDGSHFEQSSYYHLYALDMFLFHHLLEPGDVEYRQRLYRMAEYLHALVAPSGILPMLGDEDGGRFFHPYGRRELFAEATLATCAALFRQSGWSAATRGKTAEQACWYLGPQAGALPRAGEHDVLRSRLFADSGLAVMRAGEVAAIFDAGGMGSGSGGHSHADALQLLVRVGDEELLIDPGTFTYVADPSAREWFRSPAAHNTLRIDGENQGIPAGPFRWAAGPAVRVLQWASNPKHDLIHAQCELPRYRCERRVLLIKELRIVVVLDTVRGDGGGECLVEQFWHPGVPVVGDLPFQFALGADATLVFALGESAALETGGKDGWRSRAYGQREEAPVIRFALRAPLPLRLWTVVDCSAPPGPRTLRPNRSGFDLSACYSTPARRITLQFDCEGLPVRYTIGAV